MHWSQTESSKWSLDSLSHDLGPPFICTFCTWFCMAFLMTVCVCDRVWCGTMSSRKATVCGATPIVCGAAPRTSRLVQSAGGRGCAPASGKSMCKAVFSFVWAAACVFSACVFLSFLFATWTQKMLLAPYMYAHVFPRWPAARAKGRATRGALRARACYAPPKVSIPVVRSHF